MLFLFPTLLGCLVLLHLWGNGTYALLGLEQPRNPFLIAWVGLFALSLALMALSFFMPLNGAALLGVGGAALFGVPAAFRQWRTWRALPTHARQRFGVVVLAVTAGVALATAYTQWPIHQYDTDLYHAQVVRWLNTYGTTWGIGNLHSRLAQGSAWFDVASLLDNGPWDGRSAWIMVGLLVCLAGFYFLYECCFSPYVWARVYAALMFPMLLFVPETTRPNLYMDTAAMAVHCVVVLEALYLWQAPPRKLVDGLVVLVVLAALSFLIKPLTQVTVVASSLFALGLLWRKGELRPRAMIRVWLPPALAAVLWVGRNIVLSGYPLFPLPALGLPLDWTMPREDVAWNYNAVRGYARLWNRMDEALRYGITYWFPEWWVHQLGKESFRKMFLLPVLAGCVAWARVLWTRSERTALFFFGWQAACLVNWFVMAPDPRFGFGFAWSFLASGAGLALRDRMWSPRIIRGVYVVAVALLIVRLGMDLRKAPHSLLVPERIPARPVAAHMLEGQGRPFTVFVPVEGEKCGDAELPCAPKLPENLCQRQPGDLAQGFRPCIPH